LSEPIQQKLTAAETANYLRVSTETLLRWRAHAFGPKFSKLGRRILYDIAEIDRWLSDRRCRSIEESRSLDRAG
jgi:predicted DNA-binding transcriptional regulator AlpA